MPPPVEFTVRMGSLPPGFKGDPQALATAIAERMIIAPSEPWSSFVNGGAQPASNLGPYVANGNEWKFWSDDLGTYTYQVLDGAGLKAGTVSHDALEDGVPNTAFIYDATGRPIMQSGLPGQVLTVGNDLLPKFLPPATGVYFTAGMTADFAYPSDGASHVVPFDKATFQGGVTFDPVNFRIPVTAGSVWVLGGSLQIENTNGGTSTGIQHSLSLRPYGLDAASFGSLVTLPGPIARQGLNTQGLYFFQNPGFVDLVVATVEAVPGNNFAVSANGINTRFFGWRLI
jgi:hypothetical protein